MDVVDALNDIASRRQGGVGHEDGQMKEGGVEVLTPPRAPPFSTLFSHSRGHHAIRYRRRSRHSGARIWHLWHGAARDAAHDPGGAEGRLPAHRHGPDLS